MENRQRLADALAVYQTSYPEEAAFIPRFLELLTSDRCYFRDHLPAHLTASAFVLNPDETNVVLLLHRALNKWLQPGGHADGDENLVQVALKEVCEETGLHHVNLKHVGIFDLDIHPIPERNGFPEHLHYDVRMLLRASDNLLTQNSESLDVRWVPLKRVHEVSGSASIMRMVQKVIAR